jgi:hypothetical protein
MVGPKPTGWKSGQEEAEAVATGDCAVGGGAIEQGLQQQQEVVAVDGLTTVAANATECHEMPSMPKTNSKKARQFQVDED